MQMILNDGQHDGPQIMSLRVYALKSIYYEEKMKYEHYIGANEKHRYCDLASEKALYHT